MADLQQRSSPDRDIRLWLFYFVCASTDRSTTSLSEIHSRFFFLYIRLFHIPFSILSFLPRISLFLSFSLMFSSLTFLPFSLSFLSESLYLFFCLYFCFSLWFFLCLSLSLSFSMSLSLYLSLSLCLSLSLSLSRSHSLSLSLSLSRSLFFILLISFPSPSFIYLPPTHRSSSIVITLHAFPKPLPLQTQQSCSDKISLWHAKPIISLSTYLEHSYIQNDHVSSSGASASQRLDRHEFVRRATPTRVEHKH